MKSAVHQSHAIAPVLASNAPTLTYASCAAGYVTVTMTVATRPMRTASFAIQSPAPLDSSDATTTSAYPSAGTAMATGTAQVARMNRGQLAKLETTHVQMTCSAVTRAVVLTETLSVMAIEIALTIAMKMSDMDVWIASVVLMNSDVSREFAVATIPSA